MHQKCFETISNKEFCAKKSDPTKDENKVKKMKMCWSQSQAKRGEGDEKGF